MTSLSGRQSTRLCQRGESWEGREAEVGEKDRIRQLAVEKSLRFLFQEIKWTKEIIKKKDVDTQREHLQEIPNKRLREMMDGGNIRKQ